MKNKPKHRIYPHTARKMTRRSLAAALIGWLLLSALNLFTVWAVRDRARLIRDNDNERTFNTLMTEMRNYSDLGSAIEANPDLKERIIGAAIYDNSMMPILSWGKVPPVFDESILEGYDRNRQGRYTIPNREDSSIKFIVRYGRMGQGSQRGQQRMSERQAQTEDGQPGDRSPGRRQGEFRQGGEQGAGIFTGRYLYTDISHSAYWHTRTLTTVLFPLIEVLLLGVVLFVRRLYLRNREYREKIDAQQNLVVLGTAAGTLAHEIKNPLLSIRLQTGILEKVAGEQGKSEINIINQEVDRLSSLVYRVNDYLRDPSGEQKPFDLSKLLDETSVRIFGSHISDMTVKASNPTEILADENRIRSVLENIMRNALESGSEPAELGAQIVSREGSAVVTIVDRGRGIAEENIKRIFDPFFTSKSTGTGIGLAISKRFTEAAGGSIEVQNREGGGLVVKLVFPLYTKA